MKKNNELAKKLGEIRLAILKENGHNAEIEKDLQEIMKIEAKLHEQPDYSWFAEPQVKESAAAVVEMGINVR